MTDFIVVLILVVVIGSAARYVYKAKKSGAKCIGCSVGEGCCCSQGTSDTACSCGCGEESSGCCCSADNK